MKATHLLVLFMLFMAIGDQVFILRLKLPHGPKARLHAYWLILSWLWLATIAAVWITGPRALWYASLNPGEGRWLPGSVVAGLIAVISLIALFLPVVFVMRKPSAAPKLARALDKLRFFLPTTPRERFWWALLSITAGICEETLFRSFLLQYLRADPWRLGLTGAIAVACLLFALGHLYQGIAAAIGTGLLAVLFFILFLGSGTLLIPMLLHALADLRVLLFLRLADSRPAK
jgi:membrane protease YdiL (CAAX protease family)